MHPDKRRFRLLLAVLVAVALGSADAASAGTRLYTGAIRLTLASYFVPYTASSFFPTTYGIPFGAGFSYPSLNNLPAGNLAGTSGSGPMAFTLGANQMALKTSLSTSILPTPWTASFVETSFSGANAAGSFKAGGGPGVASSGPLTSIPASRFGVSFKGSPTRFGGTMRLLGFFEAQYQYYGQGGQSCYRIRVPWVCPLRTPLSAIGGSFGGSAKHFAYSGGTASPATFFYETVWGFPWTTGTVRAVAPATTTVGGASTTATLTAMGSDQRTSQGAGMIQLVSPFVVRREIDWGGAAGNQPFYRAGTAVMTLRFVPEPARLMQLASGLLGLVALYGFSHRKTGH